MSKKGKSAARKTPGALKQETPKLTPSRTPSPPPSPKPKELSPHKQQGKPSPDTLTPKLVHITVAPDSKPVQRSYEHRNYLPVDLNVGGVLYTTSLATVTKVKNSWLAAYFKEAPDTASARDSDGRVFIDRDGELFRHILDYLRDLKLVLPPNFGETDRLRQEAQYYGLPDLVSALPPKNHPGSQGSDPRQLDQIASSSPNRAPGFITLSCRGTFSTGRDRVVDVKFQKRKRINVCGRVSLCHEVFHHTLNESRDPNLCEEGRYTSRFYLTHTFLEQAFDMLQEEGFFLVGVCGAGASSTDSNVPGANQDDEGWHHYNEYVFERR